jgi:signal transduction histidine kinase
MPNGGSLQIACENRRVEAGNKSPDLTTGDYVVVTVTDTGAGMSDATPAHAFEPFLQQRRSGGALAWVYRWCKGLPSSQGERCKS